MKPESPRGVAQRKEKLLGLLGGDGRKVPSFAPLRAFEAVGRLGGVRRAALELGLDHAVVSRHLRALETWAGVVLIDRARSGALLTEQGKRYHARIAVAFTEIMAATEELLRDSNEMRLRLWCVPGLAYRWLMTRIDGFCSAHPEVDLELHPTDASPDFAQGEADADLRYIPQYKSPPSSLLQTIRSIDIDRPAVVPVASPTYLAKLDVPILAPMDLLRLRLLHEETHDYWRSWFSAQGAEPVGPLAGAKLWHAHLTVEAACRGEGIALANHFLFGADLQSGRLVPVPIGGESARPVELGAYVFSMRRDRWESPAASLFRQWLRRAVISHRRQMAPNG